MLNRWQAHKGAACGEVAPIIMCLEVAQHCSTSSTPNDSEVSAPRRLRYRSTSGYAWFAISDGTSSLRSLGVMSYAPTASHLPQTAHSAHNLVSGCIFNNLTFTTRVANSATLDYEAYSFWAQLTSVNIIQSVFRGEQSGFVLSDGLQCEACRMNF